MLLKEAVASEFLENLDDVFLDTAGIAMYVAHANLQLHTDVSPVSKRFMTYHYQGNILKIFQKFWSVDKRLSLHKMFKYKCSFSCFWFSVGHWMWSFMLAVLSVCISWVLHFFLFLWNCLNMMTSHSNKLNLAVLFKDKLVQYNVSIWYTAFHSVKKRLSYGKSYWEIGSI